MSHPIDHQAAREDAERLRRISYLTGKYGALAEQTGNELLTEAIDAIRQATYGEMDGGTQ